MGGFFSMFVSRFRVECSKFPADFFLVLRGAAFFIELR